jgi:hypothetical protein
VKSLDAVTFGLVREQKRAVWALSHGGETVFLHQGVFVP